MVVVIQGGNRSWARTLVMGPLVVQMVRHSLLEGDTYVALETNGVRLLGHEKRAHPSVMDWSGRVK